MQGVKRGTDGDKDCVQFKKNLVDLSNDDGSNWVINQFSREGINGPTDSVEHSTSIVENLQVPRAFEICNGHFIGDGYPCYIIAEIGQNHQGDFEIAKKMIKEAKECGANCVKFQKSDLSAKFTKSVLSREYQSPHSFGDTYGQHKKFLEFSEEQYAALKAYAESLLIHFSASAMDEVSKLIFSYIS